MTKFQKKSKFLIIISFVLTFALMLSLADFCSSIIAIKTFSSTSTINGTNAYKIYAISLFSSQTKSLATESAVTIQNQNGAGYIYAKNNTYYVIASAYLEENDAKLVKANLEENNLTPEIIEISIGEIKLSSTRTTDETNTLVDALKIYKTTFENLYDISVALDTQVSSQAECKLFVADVVNLASKVKINFEATFPNETSSEIIYLKLTLSNLLSILEELKNYDTSNTNTQTFSSKIKYTYMSILNLNLQLKNKI